MTAVSSNEAAAEKAFEVLQNGGSAIDAVEEGIRVVESDPDDHSVGYSGYPNIVGQVELDASIMDGRTRRTGAVAGLRLGRHAISVARKVMEELPHDLLVGQGADRFAREMGFVQEDMLTEATRREWRDVVRRVSPDRPLTGTADADGPLRHLVTATRDPEKPTETVNLMVVDRNGDLASGASTSGWAWKYPGRVGDSPVIGAGDYADNRYGAAACTGRGEMAIRAGSARSVVLCMKMGLSLEEALREAMGDLAQLDDPYFGWVDIIALSADGETAGATWKDDRHVYVRSPGMIRPEKKPKIRLVLSR